MKKFPCPLKSLNSTNNTTSIPPCRDRILRSPYYRRHGAASATGPRSVLSVTHPCAQRLWMPVQCSIPSLPPQKNLFREIPSVQCQQRAPANLKKKIPCPPKSLNSTHNTPSIPPCRDRILRSLYSRWHGAASAIDPRSVPSVAHPCAQRLWMPVQCSIPSLPPKNLFREIPSVQCPQRAPANLKKIPCPPKSLNSTNNTPSIQKKSHHSQITPPLHPLQNPIYSKYFVKFADVCDS